MTCCRYKSKGGRCLNCACVKAGRRCTDCLPSRNGHCSNPNNNGISSPVLALNSSVALESPQSPPVTASCLHSCPCGMEDPTQPLIRCHGPGNELFHYNCSGITSPRRKNKMTGCVCGALFCSHKTQKPSGISLKGRASKGL